MVKVGDTILIKEDGKAIVTTLFQVDDGRWFVGYHQPDGRMGFFLEGDKEFRVIGRNRKI